MKLFLLFFVFGNIVVLGSSSLTSSNIKSGVTIFGVTGSFTGWVDDQSASYWATTTSYDDWHGSRQMWCEERWVTGLSVTAQGWNWINIYVDWSARVNAGVTGIFGLIYIYMSDGSHIIPAGKFANYAPMWYITSMSSSYDNGYVRSRSIPVSDFYNDYGNWNIWGISVWVSRSSSYDIGDPNWISSLWFNLSK